MRMFFSLIRVTCQHLEFRTDKGPLSSACRSLVFFFLLLFSPSISLAEMVPFVIPAQQNPHSLIALYGEPIDTDNTHNRIRVVDDHFVRDDERVKIWGVNLSFAGNFPGQADAPIVAERLAAAGINAVRCHHMDTSRYPRGLWHPQNGQTIYPEAIDRLDYFINELAKQGICINLNLHVGRQHSLYLGLPDPGTKFDKIVGIFTPELIDAQKDFAGEMLSHVNTYRDMQYADDPAIAFVEITNEDSLFMWNAMDTLRNLPDYYSGVLQKQYNDWLRNEYGTSDELRIVWGRNIEPLGENVLTSFEEHFGNPRISPDRKWYMEQHAGCKASFYLSEYESRVAARFVIDKTDDFNWHLQVKQRSLKFIDGQYYTLIFEAAGEQPRSISCDVMQNHSPWKNLGLNREVELTTEWQTFRFGFRANADDENGRVTFRFGGRDTTSFYLANVQLRTGGQIGLMENEYIERGTVQLFADEEVEERIIDRLRFLAETEKAYFEDMRSFIKNDLGCQALVTGTVVFGPLGLYAQSDMDFIDSHAYWQHPKFPNEPWDPEDWYVEQKPMTDYIEEATLFRLAGCRLGKSYDYPGKPFTVSEYNHPAPLTTQASCVPMIASFAAAQDWDGVWLYSYTHNSDDWDKGYFNRYFDIVNNPAKWGYIPAGAAIFRYQGMRPVGNTYSFIGLTDADDPLPRLARLYLRYDRDMFGVLAGNANIGREELLQRRIANTLYQTGALYLPGDLSPTTLDWRIGDDGRGIYSATADSMWIYVGHKEKFALASDNKIQVSEPQYVSLTITSLDHNRITLPLPERQGILITACGRCENTGMKFSRDRTTVGANWGGAPVQIEAVSATIRLPLEGLECYALAPDGTIKDDVPIRNEDDQTVIEISPAYKTMWYLLVTSGSMNGDGNVTSVGF